MDEIRFKKLSESPVNPVPGTFYWIGEKVWFATESGMVLLSNEVGQALLDRLEEIEGKLEGITEIIGPDGINLNNFITREEVEEMIDGITPDVELDDSDYDIIAEKVNLRWQIIK